MIVVTLTDCPPRLRGDLSKWLLEINTGVYVGQLNKRVREELWKRICDNLPRGRATMVYSANNEQGMEFRVHNTRWMPVDFEGLTLMMRPATTESGAVSMDRSSKAAISRMVQNKRAEQDERAQKRGYVVIDVETTGLDPAHNEILEIGALRIIEHKISERFSAMIHPKCPIPQDIMDLTGITQQMADKGIELKKALEEFWDFLGQSVVIGHNLSFDLAFLKKASVDTGISIPVNSCFDTLTLARRRVQDIADYRLETLAGYFEIKPERFHRALEDCYTTFQIYEKLNEIG